MISGRRKKKTKVTPKVHDKQTYKFVREGLINENMVQRSNTKSSVTSKDPIDKLQELRRTHGAGSQEYKDFLQQTLNQKKQRQHVEFPSQLRVEPNGQLQQKQLYLKST